MGRTGRRDDEYYLKKHRAHNVADPEWGLEFGYDLYQDQEDALESSKENRCSCKDTQHELNARACILCKITYCKVGHNLEKSDFCYDCLCCICEDCEPTWRHGQACDRNLNKLKKRVTCKELYTSECLQCNKVLCEDHQYLYSDEEDDDCVVCFKCYEEMFADDDEETEETSDSDMDTE